MDDNFSLENNTGCCDLDSHADTCVAGAIFAIIEHTDQLVSMTGYTSKLGQIQGLPVVTAGTVWTSSLGQAYLLLMHETVYFGQRLKNLLLCPNQLHANGVTVNNVPTQFDLSSTHSIIVNDVTIPLDLHGVVSYFETRLPTEEEIKTLPQIHLTANSN
jgi:hypothetical protein